MDQLLTFGPVLIVLAVIAVVFIFVRINSKKSASKNDQMLQQPIGTSIRDKENLIKINVRKIDELQHQNESILNGMSSSSNVCKCGYANNPSAKFCVKCGEIIDEGFNMGTSGSEYRVCTCGSQSDKNAKFCIKCGQKFETLE